MAANDKGGIRLPDYMYQHALSRVEDLMLQAVPWPQLFAKLVDEGLTESEDTAKGWRRAVMQRWAAEDAELRPARKDQWRARLEQLYGTVLEKANEASGYAQAQLYAEVIRIAKLSIVLDGVQAPVVVRHEGQVDVAAMAPHEREQEIAALLAKREAALKASQGKGAN